MIRVVSSEGHERRCTDCGEPSKVLIDISGVRFFMCELCADELRHGISDRADR